MPLQHIQLREKPLKETKQKALQNALKKGPTYTGGEVKPYAGPTPTLGESKLSAHSLAKGYFRPGAGSLEEALRAATPATGSAIDIQGQAWKRREEIVTANQAKLDAQADALYGSVQGLSKPDQDFILSKVAGKSTSAEALGKALGAAPGVISATSVGKDPLMKAMIDKNYIKETDKGYEWMLPEKEKKVVSTEPYTDEQGWLHNVLTYADGAQEDNIIGREAPEAEKGLTPSEALSYTKYEAELAGKGKEQSDKNMAKAIDMAGPRLGIGEKDSSGAKWTKERDNLWQNAVETNKAYLDDVYGVGPSLPTGDLSLSNIPDSSPEVIKKKEDVAIVKARAENDPEYIGMLEMTLGLPVTKQWNPQIEYMLFQYNLAGGQ